MNLRKYIPFLSDSSKDSETESQDDDEGKIIYNESIWDDIPEE